MNLNKLKKLFNKYFVFIFILLLIILIILIYMFLPKNISIIVYLSIFIISLVLRLIVEILSKSNQIKLLIQDKKEIIIKLYELFDLENTNTIVVLNTKDEKILSRAKKLFPGSRETVKKGLYSILLPKAMLKSIQLFLRDNNPERIIIHNFNYPNKEKKNTRTHSLSICIDNNLIIQFNKKQFSKKDIKDIKEKLIKK